MYKKLLSVFFLFLLVLPSSLVILHDLQNHEHVICTSIGEYHIHKPSLDCDEFQKQLTIYSMQFTSNYDVIPDHIYATIFLEKQQVRKEIYYHKKTSRGPPNFTV